MRRTAGQSSRLIGDTPLSGFLIQATLLASSVLKPMKVRWSQPTATDVRGSGLYSCRHRAWGLSTMWERFSKDVERPAG